MKNKKSIILASLILLSLVFAISMISASTVMTSPIAGTNTSTTLPITITTGTNYVNKTNVTCYYNSSGGAATTFLVQILNTTAPNQTTFTASPPVTALTKSLTYNISCNVYNGTTLNSTVSVYPVGIYTSTPVCGYSIDSTNVKYLSVLGVQTTDSSTKDALATLTYSWRLYNEDGSSAKTSTSASPSFSGSDFSMKGEDKLSLIVTDSLGNTNACNNQTIRVGSSDSSNTGTITTVVTNGNNNTESGIPMPLIIIGFVVIFVIILIVAVLVIETSKKKRR